ncbi:flavin-dependent monooxygenase [Rhodococcus sp. D2-41]|uniref:Acyl-CoA dehydrogenase family protein n=1 Tax=Speluncibacter jeojiensis TaxID=2710754 RepID=A0A9X4M569_9ACTN|nr:acyl-CoA dehydrogenase family protein [Rhodococcus sp. D2-41]MDG3008957.1 flavin-dependent monooxygenase [Rhodococcus sp. D2-41]MDG3015468.1 acyl-CoA dehydrogenase family protein [Corynebacteriales bacterium D3-21]
MVADDVLGKVRAVLPALAEAAEATERDRRIGDAAIGSLTDAGLFRMMLPARFSGLESTPLELFTAIRAVSSACASTGWVASTLCLATWQVALFDTRAQEEVWDGHPDSLVAAAYQPAGRLRPDGDRFRLTGRWRYVSGCEHSAWLFVGALVLDEAGDSVEHALVLVPRADVTVHRGPDCVGLRAAANTEIMIEDAAVPSHRVYGAQQRALRENRKYERALRPLYRHLVTPMYTVALTVPLIGAAEGALRHFTGSGSAGRVGVRMLENEAVHIAIARAAYEIDTAAAQIDGDLAEMHALVVAAKPMPVELSARVRRDQVLATERVAAAVDRLLRAGGRPCLASDNPVQRAWRDIHVGAAHRVNEAEDVLAIAGRAALGVGAADEPIFV